MKFSIKDFFSKCDQIRNFLGIWSHLLKKSIMENFIFCALTVIIDRVIINIRERTIKEIATTRKVSKYGVFSGP